MTTQDSNHKTCPTCGARLEAEAARCTVCGRVFHSDQPRKEKKSRAATDAAPDMRAQRMPEVSLSLPVAIAIVILAFVIGAGVFFLILREQDVIVEPTITVTPSQTATITVTPTSTLTPTPLPTLTPLPPVDYTVVSGDNCGTIALLFDVSVQSIILANNLAADCGGLVIGQVLSVPQPTPTPSPAPTSTLSALEATDQACEKIEYTVDAGNTLSYIADLYDVSIETIKSYNSLTSDSVFQGQVLEIPLCERLPTPGPTPTATLPPPYYAPQLLLPRDGEAFMKMTDTITLQWESVGALRANEAYAVTIEDVTAGDGTKVVAYVTDTKYIVPEGLRPTENIPHIFRWWIMPVRQVGSTDTGEPVWDTAGEVGALHVFSWWGVGE